MFWVRLNDLFQLYCILLMVLVWIIVLCLIYSLHKEEIKENRKYDINHKTIKDIKVRKEEKK
jgi:hypothetical protein